jgi:hypothetical protein
MGGQRELGQIVFDVGGLALAFLGARLFARLGFGAQRGRGGPLVALGFPAELVCRCVKVILH